MIFRYSRIIETLCLNHYIRSRKEGGKTMADKHFFKDKTHNFDIFLYKVLKIALFYLKMQFGLWLTRRFKSIKE